MLLSLGVVMGLMVLQAVEDESNYLGNRYASQAILLSSVSAAAQLLQVCCQLLQVYLLHALVLCVMAQTSFTSYWQASCTA